jgi:hypothetical protein
VAVDLRGLRIESFQCRNHPDREGVGICVSCRRVICVECSTKIEGVNHCRECLAKRGATAEAGARRGRGFIRRAADAVFALSIIIVSVAAVATVLTLYGDAHAHGGMTRVANNDRMEKIASALREYRRDTGEFPPLDDETTSLRALVVKPEKAKGWRGPYLDFTPVAVEQGVPDAYGTPVRYWLSPAGDRCVIGSAGPDRNFESQVVNAKRLAISSIGEAEALGDDIVLVVD